VGGVGGYNRAESGARQLLAGRTNTWPRYRLDRAFDSGGQLGATAHARCVSTAGGACAARPRQATRGWLQRRRCARPPSLRPRRPRRVPPVDAAPRKHARAPRARPHTTCTHTRRTRAARTLSRKYLAGRRPLRSCSSTQCRSAGPMLLSTTAGSPLVFELSPGHSRDGSSSMPATRPMNGAPAGLTPAPGRVSRRAAVVRRRAACDEDMWWELNMAAYRGGLCGHRAGGRCRVATGAAAAEHSAKRGIVRARGLTGDGPASAPVGCGARRVRQPHPCRPRQCRSARSRRRRCGFVGMSGLPRSLGRRLS
jgi:hypothetical protein